MKDFSDYLKKFTLLLSGKVLQTGAVISAIEETTGVLLQEKNIKLQSGVLFISASPLSKNHIYMNKEKVLIALNEKGVPNITEIR